MPEGGVLADLAAQLLPCHLILLRLRLVEQAHSGVPRVIRWNSQSLALALTAGVPHRKSIQHDQTAADSQRRPDDSKRLPLDSRYIWNWNGYPLTSLKSDNAVAHQLRIC